MPLVSINAAAALFRPVAARIPGHIEPYIVPVVYANYLRSFDLLVGIVLAYLAYQLWRRRRSAWWLTVCLLILIALIDIIWRPVAFNLIPQAIALVVLLASYHTFSARAEPISIKKGLLVFFASLLFAVGYGTIGFYFLSTREFGIDFSFLFALENTLRYFLLFGNPVLHPYTRFAHWFLNSLGILGVLSIAYGLYNLFRPLEIHFIEVPRWRQRATRLLAQYSHSSEDFFKIYPTRNKIYFFSRDGQAVLAYTVKNGVALVIGDPVGAATSVRSLLSEFVDQAQRNSWEVCFAYVSLHWKQLYLKQGLEMIKIGEDAMVDLAKFTAGTIRNKHWRNIRNRFNKLGFTYERVIPARDSDIIDEVAAVSDAWMAQPGRKEWQFFAGSFSRDYMQHSTLHVVRDAGGRVVAFANQVPTFQTEEATVDLMRYMPGAPANCMDWLFLCLLESLNQDGYHRFNLGLAPLSGLSLRRGKMEERFMSLLYQLDRGLSFQGLRQFKEKFEPIWQPKYVAYDGSISTITRAIVAVARVA